MPRLHCKTSAEGLGKRLSGGGRRERPMPSPTGRGPVQGGARAAKAMAEAPGRGEKQNKTNKQTIKIKKLLTNKPIKVCIPVEIPLVKFDSLRFVSTCKKKIVCLNSLFVNRSRDTAADGASAKSQENAISC